MVKRYQPNINGRLIIDEDGRYVDYLNYQRLESRFEEIKFLRDTTCKAMQEFADELGCKPDNEVILQAIDDLKSKVAELEKQWDALVAENAALKSAAEFSTAPDMWIEQADGMLDYRYHEWYVDVLKAAMEAQILTPQLLESGLRRLSWRLSD